MRRTLIGLILAAAVLPSLTSSQVFDSVDLLPICKNTYFFEDERTSCDLAHLYTTSDFLAKCKATQQILFDQRIPQKEGCNSRERPNVVVLEFDFDSLPELQNAVNSRETYAFTSASRLNIINLMRNFDSNTGIPSGDPFRLQEISRLTVGGSHARPTIELLTPEEFPVWMRKDITALYDTQEPEYTEGVAKIQKRADLLKQARESIFSE